MKRPPSQAGCPVHVESLGPDAALAGKAVRHTVRFIRTAERNAVGYTHGAHERHD